MLRCASRSVHGPRAPKAKRLQFPVRRAAKLLFPPLHPVSQRLFSPLHRVATGRGFPRAGDQPSRGANTSAGEAGRHVEQQVSSHDLCDGPARRFPIGAAPSSRVHCTLLSLLSVVILVGADGAQRSWILNCSTRKLRCQKVLRRKAVADSHAWPAAWWQVPGAASSSPSASASSSSSGALMRGRKVAASSTRQSGRAPGTLEDGPHVSAFLQLGASLDDTGGQADVPLRREPADIERMLAARGLSPPPVPPEGQHAARAARGGGEGGSTPETRLPFSGTITSALVRETPVSMSLGSRAAGVPPQLSVGRETISRERLNYFAVDGRREAPSPPAGVTLPTPGGCEVVESLVATPATLAGTSVETPGSAAGTPLAAHGVGLDQPVLATSRLSGWSIEKIARGEY